MRLGYASAVLAATALTSCMTAPPSDPSGGQPTAPGPEFSLTPNGFDTLPGWYDADLAPALLALQRQCSTWSDLPPQRSIGEGRYGGMIADWLPACEAASEIAPGEERTFFESNFAPAEVGGGGETKLTAYYEPVILARRKKLPGYTEPLLRPPPDLVTVDVDAFSRDDEPSRRAPRILTGRVRKGKLVPYPKRGNIPIDDDQVIAYAHPADVYNLQVQGSGRLRFEDGTETRAAYAGQNGYRWRSALGALRSRGAITEATWASFRKWMDAHPGKKTTEALNADPSYVFFQEENIDDLNAGPRGAAGVPLTPLGSVAVDPAFHPYGALVFVDGRYDGAPFQRLLVAQDTGGAIKRGPTRGDVFFGTGIAAGDDAERMNAPARWWTLVPKSLHDSFANASARNVTRRTR